MLRCFLFLLVLVFLSQITIVALLGSLMSMAQTTLKAAPGMVDDYIKTNAGDFLDEHIRESVPEVVQEAILGVMMGSMNGASTDSSPDGSGTEMAEDQFVPTTATTTACDGVHSETLCSAFVRTCADFNTCTTQRTDAACTAFVRDLGYVCSTVRCDVFDDKSVCDRAVTMCNNRQRALYDQRTREFMEEELHGLCEMYGQGA